MSTGNNEKDDGGVPHGEDGRDTHGVLHDEVRLSREKMDDAILGENAEHAMGMWTAVRAHPWACLWAFTM
jgi:SP family general alpha glucoside:H+ symporter-like MFS transporter